MSTFFYFALIVLLIINLIYRLTKRTEPEEELAYSTCQSPDTDGDHSKTDASLDSNQDPASRDAATPPRSDGENGDRQDVTAETKKIMYDALCELGCQPQLRDNGDIVVQYQGETFVIVCHKRYATVLDLFWSWVYQDDPKLALLYKAINNANRCDGPTLYLGDPDSEGKIYFCTRICLMLYPMCPENTAYIRANLHALFEAKSRLEQRARELDHQNASLN